MTNKQVRTVSFGCRLNYLEEEIIRQHSQKLKDDILIINSCCVTNEAERQLRQFIRKEKKRNQDLKIVLTGCAVKTNKESYEQMFEVDYIVPNNIKLDKNIWETLENIESSNTDADYVMPPIIDKFEDRQRAFVQIQNGCDRACTYCATRLARGESISFPYKHILEQIQALKNYKEIVITGVNITSYKYDNLDLKTLIIKILKDTSIPRIRLSSLDIADIDEEFIELITSEKRIMPHFHFSLQAGDNEVLYKMARRHTREEVLEKTAKIKELRPETSFGADIITGFPTETEDMFQNSVDLVTEANIPFLHVFPYSEKQGTVAAKMKQVEVPIRKRRARELREVAKDLMHEYLKTKIGTMTPSLIEGGFIARADDYSRIVFEGDAKIGSIQEIKIIEVNIRNMLRGKICSKN